MRVWKGTFETKKEEEAKMNFRWGWSSLERYAKRHTNWKTRNTVHPKTLIATHFMCVKKYCMNNSTIPNMTCRVKEAKPEMNVMKKFHFTRREERCELFLLEKCAASWLKIPLFRYHDEFGNFSWDFHTSLQRKAREIENLDWLFGSWGQKRSWKVWEVWAHELIMMYEDHVRESKKF